MAALVPQRTSFPIVAGQEQGAAPELLDPPVLVRAHNCYYNRAGELTKRRGWRLAPATADAVSGYPYLPIPDRVATRGDEILWIGETYGSLIETKEPIALLSRVPGETHKDSPPERWRNKGPMPRFSSRKLLEVVHSNAGERVRHWDCATAGDDGSQGETDGVVCAAWRTGYSGQGNNIGNIEFSVIDVRTRSVLFQSVVATEAYSDSLVRVIAVKHADGDWYFHVFYVVEVGQADAGDVYVVTIPAERPWDASAPSQFAFGVTNFDAYVNDVNATERRVFTAVTLDAVPDVLTCVEYIPSAGGVLTFVASASITLDVVVGCLAVYWSLAIACDPEGNEIGCHMAHTATGCVGNPGNIYALFKAGVAPAHSLSGFDCIRSATTADASGGYGGTQICWAGTHVRDAIVRHDNFWISWERVEPNDQGLLYQLAFSVAAPPLTLEIPRGTTMTRRPWGRPFWFRGSVYIPTVQGSTSDTCVLELVSPYRAGVEGGDPVTAYWVAGRALSGEIGFATGPQSFNLAKGRNSFVASNYQSGRFFSIVPVVSIDGTQHSLALIDFDAREEIRFESTEIDGATYFASSIPWCYDGSWGHEIGFPCRPQYVLGEIFAEAVASANPMTVGTYYVAACWESVDALGKRSQSAPSKRGPVTVATGETIRLTYLNLCETSHHNARLVVYVSNDGGINYVRSSQVIENQEHVGSQSQVALDSFALFTTGAPTLYTDSGILSNAPPPSARFACEFQGRVWFANDRNVYPSRELVDGEEPCFNEALWFRVHHDITGILGFDDRLVIWHRNGLYWVAGDGPTDTGEGGSFSQPQRVPTDFGCIDARSIVRTSKGILYQSTRGIELIDQSLVPRSEPVSGGIDRLLRESVYSEVTTASWDQRYAIARFVLRNPNTGFCIIAQWHATFELWTTSSMPVVTTEANRVDTFGDIVSAFGVSWMAIHDSPTGAHAADPTCYLLHEKQPGEPLLYLDGFDAQPNDYQMQVETANVKLEGLAGFVRVRRVYVLAKDLYEESGTSQTGFGLRVAVDYSATPERESTWVTADDVDACKTASGEHYRFGIHVAKQQCSAIRLLIRDSGALESNDQYSYGFTLVGFGIEWGQKVGTGRGNARSKK